MVQANTMQDSTKQYDIIQDKSIQSMEPQDKTRQYNTIRYKTRQD